MPEKSTKVTKRVIKKSVTSPKKKTLAENAGETSGRARKACYFCESKTLPSYTDVNTLKRFLTERSKIVPKLRSGLCSKHQRRVTSQIKYARHLALLPFTPGV